MKRLNLALTPNVLLYAAGGAVLGLILGIWMQAGIQSTIASVIVLTILSGFFGMFVDVAPLFSWCRLAVGPRRNPHGEPRRRTHDHQGDIRHDEQ